MKNGKNENGNGTMREIIGIKPLDNRCLEVEFDDGERSVVDITPLIESREIFKDLKDERIFKEVKVDYKFGGVKWPSGADICIDWIEAQIAQKKRDMKP